MNILKVISLLLVLLPPLTLVSNALNLTLNDWNLKAKMKSKSIDVAIKKYFLTVTCKLRVSIHLEYAKHWQIYTIEYMADLLKGADDMKFEIYINGYGGTRNKEPYYNNLWYVDSYIGFRSLLPDFEDQKIGRYVVIMETAKNLQTDQELRQIFQNAFELNIYNIVVAVYVGKNRFVLYSYNIFRPGKCREVVQEQVNIFQNGTFESTELFPYKFGNFYNCPIHIYVRDAAPYFDYTLTRDGQYIDSYMGLEAKIVDTMKEKLHFNLRLFNRNASTSGSVYDTGLSTGPFLLLKRGHFDIIMGYYNSGPRTLYFSSSKPYSIVPLVVVFHEMPKVIIDGWWLLDAFQNRVWFLIFFVVGVSATTVHYVHYAFRNVRFPINVTWLDILGLTLGNSRPLNFHYFSTKYASLMWCIGFMILCAIFQGKLCDAFNRKFAPSFDRLQKLVDSNTTFILGDNVEKDIVDAINLPLHQIRYHKQPDGDNLYENMRNFPNNAATITDYWQFLSYVKRYHRFGEFGMLPSAVIYNQLCAYMRRNSYLNEPLLRLLNNLYSSGLLTKWIQEVTVYDTYNDVRRANQQYLIPQPLPMVKMRIVFMGATIMYAASIVVFIGEIAIKRLSIRCI